jgi:hypothetical protein
MPAPAIKGRSTAMICSARRMGLPPQNPRIVTHCHKELASLSRAAASDQAARCNVLS